MRWEPRDDRGPYDRSGLAGWDPDGTTDDRWEAFGRRRPRLPREERAWTNAIGGAAAPIVVHTLAWCCSVAMVRTEWDRESDRMFLVLMFVGWLETGLLGACLPLGLAWVFRGGYDRVRGVALLTASVVGAAAVCAGIFIR